MPKDNLILEYRFNQNHLVPQENGLGGLPFSRREVFDNFGTLRRWNGICWTPADLKTYAGGGFSLKPMYISQGGEWRLVKSDAEAYSFPSVVYGAFDGAYSFRRVVSGYSGSCIRIRRSSDNTEQDFGFVNNVLDTKAILTFCGTGNGFVRTWYDQSGNARHLSQTTTAAQPQLVSSGSLILLNNRLSMLITPSQFLQMPAEVLYTNIDFAFFTLYAKVNAAVNDAILIASDFNYVYLQYGTSMYVGNTQFTGYPLTSGKHVHACALRNGSTVYSYRDGHLHNTLADAVTNESWLYLACNTSTGVRNSDVYVTEVLVSPTADLNKRSALDSNINKFYNLY